MQTVAIDPTKGARKVLTLPHDLAAKVDRYRRTRQKIPPESKALVELIRMGIKQIEQEDQQKDGRK